LYNLFEILSSSLPLAKLVNFSCNVSTKTSSCCFSALIFSATVALVAGYTTFDPSGFLSVPVSALAICWQIS
jgi:hypothetical protein